MIEPILVVSKVQLPFLFKLTSNLYPNPSDVSSKNPTNVSKKCGKVYNMSVIQIIYHIIKETSGMRGLEIHLKREETNKTDTFVQFYRLPNILHCIF